ncbi:MAG: cysteine dioxygenase family protein [Phycisphaerae bacterium]
MPALLESSARPVESCAPRLSNRGSRLDRLLAALDQFADPIPLAALKRLLAAHPVRVADLARYVRFGAPTYRRNLVRRGPGYEALVLCWRSGQRSPIHDHRGSACALRVVAGVATETLFARSAAGLVYPLSTARLAAGRVRGSYDHDMHQLGNLERPGRALVTLHVYSPPLAGMRTHVLGDCVRGEYRDVVEAVAAGPPAPPRRTARQAHRVAAVRARAACRVTIATAQAPPSVGRARPRSGDRLAAARRRPAGPTP